MRKKKYDGIKLPKITVLPSGAAHTRVMINGQRISITADSEQECIAQYLAMKHGVKKAEKKGKPKRTTLSDALTTYIEARREFRSPSTIYGYESYVKMTFQDMMKANVFTTSDAEWQAAIKREMRSGKKPKYIKNAWMLMSAAIYETTRRRPEVMLPEKEVNERPCLDPEQIDIFVAAIKGMGQIEIAALLELSSLRRSEMLAVKPEHVDLKKGTISIQGAKVAGNNGKLVHKSKTKTTLPAAPFQLSRPCAKLWKMQTSAVSTLSHSPAAGSAPGSTRSAGKTACRKSAITAYVTALPAWLITFKSLRK